MSHTASGRSLNPQFAEAQAAFDAINAQLRERLNFMLTGFTHIPGARPQFSVTLTDRQAELIAEALEQVPPEGEAQRVIIAGNPLDGFEYVGPFRDPEAATRWAEWGRGSESWWMAQLTTPDEMPERDR